MFRAFQGHFPKTNRKSKLQFIYYLTFSELVISLFLVLMNPYIFELMKSIKIFTTQPDRRSIDVSDSWISYFKNSVFKLY